MKHLAGIFMGIAAVMFVIFSYGFVDPNIVLSTHKWYDSLHEPLRALVFEKRPFAVLLYSALIIVMYGSYISILRRGLPNWKTYLVGIIGILIFSYSALTHDVFNYMTTAKVFFAYGENPYVVMPVEIPNEPYLSFTRAANKYALYGPIWILLTGIPYVLGAGNVWGTIIAHKLVNAIALFALGFIIFRLTKSKQNVLYFLLNPLVLIEVMVSGHNDIIMMIPAILGLFLWSRTEIRKKATGLFMLFISVLIKSVTMFLLPLLWFRLSWEKMLVCAYWIFVFVILFFAPLREEMYPWYAVWVIPLVSLLPLSKHVFLRRFTIVLSFAMELRHIPYMWMGYYEGPGPLLRALLFFVPVVFFLVFSYAKTRKILFR